MPSIKDSLPSNSFAVLFADAVGASISTKIGNLADVKLDREVTALALSNNQRHTRTYLERF